MRTILKKLNSKYNEDNLVAHFLVSLNDSSINIRGNSIMFALKSKWTKVVSFLLVFIFSFSFTGGSFLTSQWINNVNVVYAAGGQEENKDQQEEATNSDKDDFKMEHSTEDDKASKEETQHNKELQQMIELPEDGEYLKPITIEAYGELFIDEDEEEISHEDYENAYVERVDNEDGSHTASLYTNPIRYEEESGDWVEINNELEKVEKGTSTLLQSKATPVKLQLPSTKLSNESVTLTDGDETISFKPITNKISTRSSLSAKNDVKYIKIDDDNKKVIESAQLETSQSYDAVKYENVFDDNADIVMQSVTNGVKEEIILNTIPEQEEFSFEFTISGLKPVLRTDNNLFFIDKEQKVAAVVPAPVMWDSAVEQRESYDIEVSVKKISDTKFVYTLKPDRQWLADEDIVYPVTIDPSTKFQREMAYETFITEKYEQNNYYADSHVKVGNSNDLGRSRGLFGYHYFKDTIGDNKKITKATFTAYQDYVGASTPTIGLYMVTSYYHNEKVTWKNQPTYSSVMASKAVSATGRHTWDATKLAQAMYSEDREQFMIRNTDESVNKYKRFRSGSYSNTSTDWPVYEITYVDAPSAPASVTVETTGWTKDQIKVSWGTINQPTGATLTEVQYSTTSATSGFAKIPSPSNLKSGSATLDLPDGPTYVWIRGKNSLGLCGPAKQSNIKQQRDRTAPNIPNTLTGTPNFNKSSGSLTATWSASADKGSGIDHYNLRLKKDDGAWGSDVDTTSLSHTYTGLQDGSTYQLAVRAYDKLGNVSGWKFSSTYTVGDYTPPSAPSSFTITPSDWTNNTTPLLKWSGVTDDNLEKVEYMINNRDWISVPTSSGTSSGSHYISGQDLPDGYNSIWLRGVDKNGNAGNHKIVTYKKDTTAPNATITIPNSKPIGGKITIHANIENESYRSEFDCWELKYGLGTDVAPADMITIAEGNNLVSNDALYSWNISGLEENQVYSLYLYASDEAGNTSVSNSVTILKAENSEEVAPQLIVTDPKENEILNNARGQVYFEYLEADKKDNILSTGLLIANGSAIGLQHNNSKYIDYNFGTWDSTINDWQYPEGQYVFMYVQGEEEDRNPAYSIPAYRTVNCCTDLGSMDGISNAQNVVSNREKITIINTGGHYAQSGQFDCLAQKFAGHVNYIDLIVEEDKPDDTSINYQVSTDGGVHWDSISPVSTDGGKNVNLNNRKYFYNSEIGNDVRIRAILETDYILVAPSISYIGMDVGYTVYSTAVLVDNDFAKNARGFTSLENVVHDEANSRIILSEGSTEGSIRSTVRTTPCDVIEAVLNVDAVTPEGSYIDYFISTDGGATYEQITPGNPNVSADWKKLETEGKKVILRAQLHSDGTAVPELKSWRLSVKTLASGQPHMVKLVDDPTNLSALNGANYQTLLRWKGSATEGVTYNIYRSETPYFTPAPSNLIASGIEETSWSDYNLNYGKTFYYQVTAVKQMGGHDRESLPSNQAWATVVDENEVQKRFGLQDYWSYMGFKTGSGDGYINVSNGNVSYISTDMMVSDPFFAMVMRRTYNSMATTKTPLGYGWDFSFNTALLREYSSENIETGMILKDGDGSFHRFKKNSSGGYDSAKGTFMKLDYDETADEYTITRKDNIVYHFDAQSMKLKSFTNPNGNALTFEYDERGNLSAVENTVGQRIEITYNVSGANPADEDYLYVNEHVDMVDTVTWKEDARTKDSAEIVYHYVYGEDDKLDRAYMVIENNNEYGESFSYNDDGELFEITNPEGKIYELTYDTSGRVAMVNDPVDESYSFTYQASKTIAQDKRGVNTSYEFDAEGRVTKFTDALGHDMNYTFNDNFQVTGVSYLNTVDGSTTPTQISYTYSYDENGNITSISGPNGSQTVYENYNEFNMPATMKVKKDSSTWVTTSYTYDDAGNLLTTTDPSGKVLTNTYGTLNGENGYLLSATDRFGKKTVYTYDEKGRVTQINEKKPDGTQIRRAAKYTYDSYGNVKTQTDALDNTTQYDYNKLGFVIKTTLPDSTYTTAEYSLIGNTLSETNAKGNTVRYTYDDSGRLTGASYPDNSTNSVEYATWDSDGDSAVDAYKVIKMDGEGRKSAEYYDKAGRIIKTAVGDLITAYEYDMIGNQVKVTDPSGRVTTAQYNALGQNTKVTGVAKNSSDNIVKTFTYDLAGNQTSVTDGNGFTTNYTYDNLNRLKQITQTVGSETYTTKYDYDLEEGGYIKNKVTDANGNADESWFDVAGRLVKEYSSGTKSMSTSYAYNANNAVTQVTRNDGSKEKNTYNALGQLTRVDYYEANADTSKASGYYITYAYDETGNVKTETVGKDGEEYINDYAYDVMDRLLQATQGKGTEGALQIDYTYDKADNLLSLSYPKEDNQSGVAGAGIGMQTLRYAYDNAGRITSVSLGNKVVREYTYSGADVKNIKDYRDIASSSSTAYILRNYTYNSLGAVTKATYTDFPNSSGSGTKKEEYTLTYDKVGNILTEKTYTNYEEEKTVNKTYEYDKIGRLTRVENDGKVTTYTYDKVGNRKTQTSEGKTLNYSYNNLDQLLNIKQGDKTISTFEYDNRGNQIKETTLELTLSLGEPGSPGYESKDHFTVTNYSYDLRNQLTNVSVKTPKAFEHPGTVDDVTYTTETTQNKYGASGKRIGRLEKGITTRYYYTGDALLYSTNEKNVLETENILDPSGSVIASKRFLDPSEIDSQKYANKYYVFNYDARGSVTNVIAPNGSVVKGYDYDEFGNTEQKGEADFLNDITFTSSVADTSSNLQYMNSRFYQPSTGRFLSQDSYSGNAYDPWTRNLYSYCGNNPVNYIDPTGYLEEWRVFAEAAQASFDYANKYGKLATEMKEKADYLERTGKWGDQANISAIKNAELMEKFYLENAAQFRSEYYYFKGLAANAKDLYKLAKETQKYTDRELASNAEYAQTIEEKGIIIKSLDFYEKVKNRGKWDYKVEKIRENNKNFKTISDYTFIYVNGCPMTWEEFGNYNYGYTGAVSGFSDNILYLGSIVTSQGHFYDIGEEIDEYWVGMGIKHGKERYQ